MTRSPRMCELCPGPLGESYIVAHEAGKAPITAHVQCWTTYKAGELFASRFPKARGGVTADVRRLHQDAETAIGQE